MPTPISWSILWPYALAALAFGYALGSIPFGLLLTRMAGLGDIRSIGSGNIGATNVLRTGNKKVAVATLLLDGGKGAAAALIALYFAGTFPMLAAGIGAVIGHCFPVWLGFKGGKGVATTLGTFIAWSWPLGIGACLLWMIYAAAFRISSLSALLGLATTAALAWLLSTTTVLGRIVSNSNLAFAATVIVALVFAMHHENIRRLLAGTEPRIGGSKKG